MDGDVFNGRKQEYTPQAKAARATYLLMTNGRMSTEELSEAVGYQYRTDWNGSGIGNGLSYLMDNISLAGVPVYEPERGYWEIIQE